MKKELLLTAMITASITTTALAASNLDISATTAAPLSMKNSIAYGGNNKVENGMFSPVNNILLGGDKNTVRSSASDSITSGRNNTTSGPGSIVSGWYNTNSATHSLVVGTSNTVGGTNNIVGGFNHANNDNAINSLLIGANNSVDGQNSVALGKNNTIAGNNGLVGGTGAKVQGNNAIAFGDSAKATYDDAYAIGRKAEATAQNTVAIGNNAKANNVMGTAIGYNAKAKNDYATAVGYSTSGTGNQSSAFGFESEASAMNATAIGSKANASGEYSTALGFKTEASNDNSVALGNYSVSAGNSAFAAGTLAKATEESSLAIGHSAIAEKQNNIAIGTNATANGEDAIAIGKAAKAIGNGAVNIGANNDINQNSLVRGTLVGSNNKINFRAPVDYTGDNTTIVGHGNIIEDSKNAIAIGNGAVVQGSDDSIAIGNGSKVAAPNSVALGDNSFVYDVESTASGKIAGITYNFAGGVAAGTVGIGGRGYNSERTITGLAAGRINEESTDAVNGSQLNATIKAIEKNHNDILDTAKGLQKLGDIVVDNANEAKKHASVVAGNNTIVTTTTNANGGVEYKVDVKDNISFGTNTDTHNVVNKDGMHAFDNGSVDTKYTANGMSIENRDTLDSAVHDVNGVVADSNNRHVAFTTNGIDAGNQVISNVAAGRVSATSTDAVNGSQLHAIKDVVDNHENRITTIEGDINTLNNRIINGGANSLNEAKSYTDQQVSSVAAASAALAGLHPLDFDKHDKWSYSVGFGNYKNANAAALGAFYRPNKNTMFNAATTVGNGRNTISLGANFKFGKSSEEVTTEDAAQLKKDMKDLSEKYNELAQKYNELAAKLEPK